MSGSLRLRHVVWIALAAVVGMVGGYVVISDLNRGDEPVRTSQLDSPIRQTTTGNGSGGEASDYLVVPNLVGQRLPAAETLLNGAGFKNYRELDATAQNRLIVDKDNWLVETQEPAAGGTVPPNTVVVLRVTKGTDDASPSQSTHGVVPNVVCAELQAAQDALRGAGFYVLTSVDGTGQGRLAIIDRNWVVIKQSETPGSSPALTTHITLTVVKHGEPTGDSGCQS